MPGKFHHEQLYRGVASAKLAASVTMTQLDRPDPASSARS